MSDAAIIWPTQKDKSKTERRSQVKLRAYSVIVSFLSLMVVSALAQTAATNTNLASTEVPRLIKFSGVAKDEAGKPKTGLVGVTFSLYKDQEGGSPLWVETENVQADASGHYTALLGSATADGVPLSLFSSAEVHWVSTQVSGQPESARVLLLSVPYALKAADAETLGGLPPSAFVQMNSNKASVATNSANSNPTANPAAPAITGSGTTDFVPLWTSSTKLGNSILYQTGGNVGVATKTPGAKLDTDGTAVAVRGTSSGTTGTGVFGRATSSTGVNFGVQGQTASTATGAAGVSGNATASTGAVVGIFGSSNSTTTNAMGVSGYEAATKGQVYGVNGYIVSTTTNAAGVNGNAGATTGQVYGVNGYTTSTGTNAAGVNGYEGAASGQVFGVSGSTNSTTDYAAGISGYEGATTGIVAGIAGGTASTTTGASGVRGSANATTGNVYGVSGYTPSTAGVGVLGTAYASSGNTTGVDGSTVSPNGIGTFGHSTSASGGTGIQGQTESTSGGAAGIFVAHGGGGLILSGLAGSNYVGKFSVDASGNGFYAGNLNVTGKLTKGSGSFKIDHPLDPANKYLSHSFVESPDMMNVYNGNITTDRHGLATVKLPDYFEALNGDFRYQLTVIGQFAQAIVKREIANNRFTIKTNKPLVKVSWQVTGIRHDAYANQYRIPVEEEKASGEQGYYLHPEVF
jgi:hypothetical protein